MIRPNPDIAKSTEWQTAEELANLAAARMKQGLAPPAEIYKVQYRSRINWADYPRWAWPVDPETFDGCCHEG